MKPAGFIFRLVELVLTHLCISLSTCLPAGVFWFNWCLSLCIY